MQPAYLVIVFGTAVLSAVLASRAPALSANRRRLVAVAVLTSLLGASQVIPGSKTSLIRLALVVPVSLVATVWGLRLAGRGQRRSDT
jgi:hypothetical protein